MRYNRCFQRRLGKRRPSGVNLRWSEWVRSGALQPVRHDKLERQLSGRRLAASDDLDEAHNRRFT